MKSASTVVAAASIPSCRTPRWTVPDSLSLLMALSAASLAARIVRA
jgi:hypothetical protein